MDTLAWFVVCGALCGVAFMGARWQTSYTAFRDRALDFVGDVMLPGAVLGGLVGLVAFLPVGLLLGL